MSTDPERTAGMGGMMKMPGLIASLALLSVATRPARAVQTLPTWTVAARPVVVIGENDALPGQELFHVRGATRLSDGRIAIADGGSSEVRFFGPDGQYLGKAGGQGRGPGEFRVIMSMARGTADTLLVFAGDPAMAWVSPAMKVVRKVPVDFGLLNPPCRVSESNKRALPDAAVLIVAQDNCRPPEEGIFRRSALVGKIDVLSGTLDTIGIFSGDERNGRSARNFGRSLQVAGTGSRLFAGDTGADSILVFAGSGPLQAVWHVGIQEEAIRDVRPQRGLPAVEMPSGRVLPAVPFEYPKTYPLFGRLLAGSAGELWVMEFPHTKEPIEAWQVSTTVNPPFVEEGGARWIILNSQGEAVAQVRTPPGFYLLEVSGDLLLGVARDEFDVESVQLYALARR